MVEIQFGSNGVSQTHPNTTERSIDMVNIQFSTVGTIARILQVAVCLVLPGKGITRAST